MLLRYVGVQATTFMTVGELQPGVEFDVPDDQAEGFLRRADVEEAPPSAPPPQPAAKPRKAAKSASTTEQLDAAVAAPEEGESRAVPDDH